MAVRLWAVAVALAVGILGNASIIRSRQPKQAIHQAIRSTVVVTTPAGGGTGFVVSKYGLILTNAHVLEQQLSTQPYPTATVYFYDDGATAHEAVVVDTEPKYDLALLQLKYHGGPFTPLKFHDALSAQDYTDMVGDTIYTVGHPAGFTYSVSAGMVGPTRRLDNFPFMFFIQTDAAINPGSSGGAVVTGDGKVLGVVSRLWTRTGSHVGIGFFIPSMYCKWYLVESGYEHIFEEQSLDWQSKLTSYLN